MADETDEASETTDEATAEAEVAADDDAAPARSVAPFIDDDDDDDDDADTADAAAGESAAVDADDAEDDAAPAKPGKSKAKGKGPKAEAEAAERTVTRRQVTSKRVTPKGGGPAVSSGPKTKAHPKGAPVEPSTRYTPPGQGAYAKGPSPWWVPALMFGLLIVGGLIIITNYMGLFGDPQNIRLVIGLLFILAGIITATQYR